MTSIPQFKQEHSPQIVQRLDKLTDAVKNKKEINVSWDGLETRYETMITQGMKKTINPAPQGSIAEDGLAQGGPIESAGGIEKTAAKLLAQFQPAQSPRLQQLPTDQIGADHQGAVLPKQFSNRALAGSDAPGQSQ